MSEPNKIPQFVLDSLKHSPEEIWKLLEDNDVVKIFVNENPVSFLFKDSIKISVIPMGLRRLFKTQSSKIANQRIELSQKKVPGPTIRILSKDPYLRKSTFKRTLVYLPADKQQAEDLRNQEKDITSWMQDIKSLLNYAQGGIIKIPDTFLPDVRPILQSTDDSRQPVGLLDAADRILKKYKKSDQQTSRIEFCREFLKKYSILGRPNYTPEKLNNRIAQYENTLKNSKLPT